MITEGLLLYLPAATVEASGFIWAISGTSVAAAPTAPTPPVATKRKSRRVGSAADMVVTVSIPFNSPSSRRRGWLYGLTPQPPATNAAGGDGPLRLGPAPSRLIGTLVGMAQAR